MGGRAGAGLWLLHRGLQQVGTLHYKKGNLLCPSPGRCGLLGPGTILAHCVHLSTAEVELLRATGAGVSHCPNSNFTLKSGVCDVQRLKKAGVKVGCIL